MPWTVKKSKECPNDKPWGVFNQQTGRKVACHASEADAKKQQRALYVNVKEMSTYLVPITKQFAEEVAGPDESVWLQAVPYGEWEHPIFGTVEFNQEIAQQMKSNFDGNVKEREVATNYDHGLDKAKGGKASGWIRQMEVRDDGLYWAVKFTEPAQQEIAAGEWKYFSPEWDDEWENPNDKKTYKYVARGGALTNQPWFPGMVPLNFSELVVEKGGTVADIKDEHAPEEHQDPPATEGGKPNPDQGGQEKNPGSRVDTPPAGKDPESEGKVIEMEKFLREKFDIPEGEDVKEHMEKVYAEVEPIRKAAAAADEKRAFSEQYPDEYKRLQRLEEKDRATEAKAFSESYAHFRNAKGEVLAKGFSQVVIDLVEEKHKAFSGGKASTSDLKEILDTIASDGIVEYSERGSSRFAEVRISDNPGKAFSELVAEVQKEDKLDYSAAVKVAAEKHPDEFAEYRRQARPHEGVNN